MSNSTAFLRPPSRSATRASTAVTEELVAYAGVNATTFGGKLQNRIGFAYTDTDRENTDPDLPVPTTFDATGRNERWEYQGTLTLTDTLGGVFGLESERSSSTRVRRRRSIRTRAIRARRASRQHLCATVVLADRCADADRRACATTITTRSAARARARVARVGRDADDSRARELRRRLQGADAVPAVQRVRQRGAGPERADAWDAGVEQHLLNDALLLSATYFGRNTRNMIDFVSCFPATDPRCATRPFGFYDNVQKTEAEGIELGLVAHIGERLRFDANYTDMETTNRAPVRTSAASCRAVPARRSTARSRTRGHSA